METLLSLALSNAVVATVLALFAAVLARLIRRPAAVHGLWLLVLLKLLTPPLVPLSVTWPRTTEIPPSAEESPSPEEPALPLLPLASSAEDFAVSEPDVSAPALPAIVFWESAISVLWLSGALVWWTIAGVRLLRFHRLLREARPAPQGVCEQARRLAASLGLRRCPLVLFVTAPLSPMLWALGFSPRLLLPAALWQRLNAEQQDTLLAHELAHLRRGDHWVRRLEFIVLGLYWWHPVVWYARRRLQEAEEECCDARVVAVLPDAAPAYAEALVETVTFLSQTRVAALIGASGAAQVPLLKRRLTMILTADPSRGSSRAGFWTVLGLGALLLPLAPGAAQTEAPASPEQPAPPRPSQQPVARSGVRGRLSATATWSTPLGMENCASCHQAPVHSRDLHGKPQKWQKTHDDAVRLWDEARRKQAELRNAANRLPTVTERERAEQIEKVQDDIELLKLQVRLRKANLHSAKAMREEYQRRHVSHVEQERRVPGSVPKDEYQNTILIMTTQTDQQEIKQAELEESLIRLKQAERRLARLQRPVERTFGGSDLREQRLRELEKKIEKILEEMKSLQREPRRDKPNDRGSR